MTPPAVGECGMSASKGSPEGDAAPRYREVAHTRSLADVATLAGYSVLALAGLFLATVADRTVAGFDADVLEAMRYIPAGLVALMVGGAQVLYLLLGIGVPLTLLVTGRFGALGRGALALVLGPLAFTGVTALAGIGEVAPPSVDVWVADWPSTGALTSLMAVIAVLGWGIPRRWRGALWGFLVLLALFRILTASSPPLDVVLAIAVGGMVGTLVVLAFGSPARRLTEAGVAAALADVGLPVTGVGLVRIHGGRRVFGALAETGRIEIAVIDGAGWHSERLLRTYRRVRFRDLGDAALVSSPQRAASTEAMLSLLARARGVQVPQVRALTRTPGGEVLLADDAVQGTTLAALDPGRLTDTVLDAAWEQVARLRRARIAHRDLQLANLLLDSAGRVWVVGFGHGDTPAADAVLAGDVAELLAATAASVGPQRAVAAAERVLGRAPLADGVARLVPPALTAATVAAIKGMDGGLQTLTDEVCRVTGIAEPRFVDVERVRPRTLLMFGMLAVAVYFLAPQLTDLPGMLAAVRRAEPAWLAALLLASAATYVGAALGLSGGTPGRIPVVEAGAVALAASFMATVTPPGVGDVALNVRYLQKRGFATPLAVSASTAKEVAVFLAHMLLLVTFAFWAGSTGVLADELDRLPPVSVIAAVVGGLLVLLGVVLAVPRVRELVRGTVVPAMRSSLEAMRGVVTNPAKLVTLFAGVTMLPLGYATALFFAVAALGGGVSFAAVALVSLTAGSVANAAPTPGGVGAVEAVLLASLTGLGLESATALAAVFLYRIATFWLPILPGFWALRALTRRELL